MKKQGGRRKRNMRQVAYTRFMLIVAFFALWIGGIGVRLVYLQVNQHAWHKEQALGVRQAVKQTRMLRGTIYDRNERALAMSLPVKTLFADPVAIDDIDGTARAVATALKLDHKELANQLKEAKEARKRFVTILKKVEDDVVQKVNKALDDPTVKKADLPNFTGLHWKDDQRRNYPYQSLAAHVIGYSDAQDDGKAGIEMSQDEVLHGAVLRQIQERDRLGRVYDETVIVRDQPGDVVLTIDAAFQNIVEEALERGVRSSSAHSGMAVVMQPKTGEILALANYPTFDPNSVVSASADNITNRAVQATYTPGSVFKVVTYGSALERSLFTPMDMISTGNGSIMVANRTFSDHGSAGTVSYAQAMARSSNVCAIKTGMRVGKEGFFATLQKMGFGSKTGIELPAETAGLVRSPEKWFGDSLASMSIGYEIGVTPLQMATAFATIANNGIRVQPRIIKEIRHSNERPKTVPEVKQTQVVTAETARHLRTMLRQVVLTGTGRRAALNGYTAAGKTGTAWKFNSATKSVDSSRYTSSFIGMAPADDPELVIAVVIDEPKGGARDGGMVAAPVFKDIAQQLLMEMKVAYDSPLKLDTLRAENEEVTPESPAGGQMPAAPAAEKKETVAEKKKPDAAAAPKAAEPKKPKVPEKTPDLPKVTAVTRGRYAPPTTN